MSFNDVFDKPSPDASLIQNRLTVTGFAITVLIFSGSFSLSLFTVLRQQSVSEQIAPIDYRADFFHIEMALALGMIISVLALTCFLLAQHLKEGGGEIEENNFVKWYQSKIWWFSAGQILLFLALTQAMSSSLTEVVYGIGLNSKFLGVTVGIIALAAWWLLFFVAPISYIWRIGDAPNRSGSIALKITYVVFVWIIFMLNAWVYMLNEASSQPGFLSFLEDLLEQLFQPLWWHQSWN